MTTALHTIRASKGTKQKRKRVGRGNASGHGTYSTRGQKGQRSRSGVSGLKRLGFRDTLRRIPKNRGFKSLRPKFIPINLSEISKVFKNGEKVSLVTLKAKGLIGKIDRKRGVKILGLGELDKKVIFQGLAYSNGAIDKINKAGAEIADQK